jgi:hypothetical protein
MPSELRSKNKPEWANKEGAAGVNLDAGPYIGIVKNNLDPARSGRLQVWVPDFGNIEDDPSSWKTVGYASPFAGHTFQPDQKNATEESNTVTLVEHTYGMWMVPPDVGTEVLVVFVAGDQDRGFWIACVNSNLSHTMWPGLGRSIGGQPLDPQAPDVAKAFDSTSNLPVAEFNQQIPDAWTGAWVDNQMPVHDYQASTYLLQGLDRDLVRGAISSSGQREVPSAVFGISTPGRPLTGDTASNYSDYQSQLNSGTYDAAKQVNARKGGHTFIMDDGAADGTDQLIRLRTSAGHQILMNDHEGIVYIANSTGTAWIEMNAIGQVQIYSAAGFAVRSEGSIDLHADKDVNIQGTNVNINATENLTTWSQKTEMNAHDTMDLLSTTALLSGTSTTTVTGATTNVSGSNGVNIAGSKVNLNSGAGPVSPTSPNTPTANSFDSTQFNTGKARWEVNSGALESIVTVAPAHEPYTRNSALDQAGRQVLNTLDTKLGAPVQLTELNTLASSAGISTTGNGG